MCMDNEQNAPQVCHSGNHGPLLSVCDLVVCRYTQWDTLTLTYGLCCSNERCREKTSVINEGISSLELRMISPVELHTGIFLPVLRRDYSSDLLLSRVLFVKINVTFRL